MERIKEAIEVMRTPVISVIGFTSSAGVSIYTFIEDMTILCQFIALILGIAIAVLTIVHLIKRIKKTNRDIKIDDIILKHPERNEDLINGRVQ